MRMVRPAGCGSTSRSDHWRSSRVRVKPSVGAGFSAPHSFAKNANEWATRLEASLMTLQNKSGPVLLSPTWVSLIGIFGGRRQGANPSG
jgi:hypothetical protein